MTYKVVRFRGRDSIYSYQVAQSGFTSKEDAREYITLAKLFQKRTYRYLICREDFNLKEYFENKID